MMTHRLVSGLA